MNNKQITEVDCHKHLGMHGFWHTHINATLEKAWARINIMCQLKYKLDLKSLETINTAFIRPILEYGDVIWDNFVQCEKNEIEKIQLEAARIETRATKLIFVNNKET